MQEKTERNAEIVELRKTMSVDEIAAKLGLHRQRIYQILRKPRRMTFLDCSFLPLRLGNQPAQYSVGLMDCIGLFDAKAEV